MRAVVLETHTVQYPDPIKVTAGASVDVLKEFDGFAWIRCDDGRLGWVPSTIVRSKG